MAEDASLRRRIANLEARSEVADALARYSHAIDYGDAEGWADVFTPDGVFDTIDRDDTQLRVIEGRAALRDFAAHFSRPPARWHKHLMFASVLTFSGETTVQNAAYHAVLVEHEQRNHVWEFGRYRDTLVACEDGRWRIAYRIAQVEAMTAGIPLLAFSHTP
jgi:uncharacterized protein (TIGR02246 family)